MGIFSLGSRIKKGVTGYLKNNKGGLLASLGFGAAGTLGGAMMSRLLGGNEQQQAGQQAAGGGIDPGTAQQLIAADNNQRDAELQRERRSLEEDSYLADTLATLKSQKKNYNKYEDSLDRIKKKNKSLSDHSKDVISKYGLDENNQFDSDEDNAKADLNVKSKMISQAKSGSSNDNDKINRLYLEKQIAQGKVSEAQLDKVVELLQANNEISASSNEILTSEIEEEDAVLDFKRGSTNAAYTELESELSSKNTANYIDEMSGDRSNHVYDTRTGNGATSLLDRLRNSEGGTASNVLKYVGTLAALGMLSESGLLGDAKDKAGEFKDKVKDKVTKAVEESGIKEAAKSIKESAENLTGETTGTVGSTISEIKNKLDTLTGEASDSINNAASSSGENSLSLKEKGSNILEGISNKFSSVKSSGSDKYDQMNKEIQSRIKLLGKKREEAGIPEEEEKSRSFLERLNSLNPFRGASTAVDIAGRMSYLNPITLAKSKMADAILAGPDAWKKFGEKAGDIAGYLNPATALGSYLANGDNALGVLEKAGTAAKYLSPAALLGAYFSNKDNALGALSKAGTAAKYLNPATALGSLLGNKDRSLKAVSGLGTLATFLSPGAFMGKYGKGTVMAAGKIAGLDPMAMARQKLVNLVLAGPEAWKKAGMTSFDISNKVSKLNPFAALGGGAGSLLGWALGLDSSDNSASSSQENSKAIKWVKSQVENIAGANNVITGGTKLDANKLDRAQKQPVKQIQQIDASKTVYEDHRTIKNQTIIQTVTNDAKNNETR